jgi:hypothetical protein
MKKVFSLMVFTVLFFTFAFPVLAYTADDLPTLPEDVDTVANPYYTVINAFDKVYLYVSSDPGYDSGKFTLVGYHYYYDFATDSWVYESYGSISIPFSSSLFIASNYDVYRTNGTLFFQHTPLPELPAWMKETARTIQGVPSSILGNTFQLLPTGLVIFGSLLIISLAIWILRRTVFS